MATGPGAKMGLEGTREEEGESLSEQGGKKRKGLGRQRGWGTG